MILQIITLPTPKNQIYERPTQSQAQAAVFLTLKENQIPRGNCCVCGRKSGVVAHHEDYDKPMEIAWLCRPHHSERHKELGWGDVANGPSPRKQKSGMIISILPSVVDQIAVVQKRLGAATMTEVIRRALALIDLASEHRAQGGKLIFRHSDGAEEILPLI